MSELHELCCLIKINRLSQNIMLDSIADEINLSSSQYSKIERGIASADSKVYEQIFDILDIDFNRLQELRKESQKRFKKIFLDIAYSMDKNMIKSAIDKWNKDSETEIISIELLLINLIYNVNNKCNSDVCLQIIKLIKKTDDLLTDMQRKFLLQYIGLYEYVFNKRLDLALLNLEESLLIGHDDVANSMIYYHLGQIYKNNKQFLKGFQSMLLARQLFSKTNNFNRCIMADISVANFYSLNCEFEEALRLYQQCIEDYRKVNMSVYSRSTSYYNITLVYNFMGKYQETLDFISTIPEDVLRFLEPINDFSLSKIIALNGLGRDKEALEICRSKKHMLDKKSIIDNFIEYYYYVNNKNKRLRCLDRIKTLVNKSGDYSWCRLLFILYRNEATTLNHYQDLVNDYHKYIFNNI